MEKGACLRLKATSQLAYGHSTCGELPKHLTSQLSSMQRTPTHPHYQATSRHLPMEVLYITSQCVLSSDVHLCGRSLTRDQETTAGRLRAPSQWADYV